MALTSHFLSRPSPLPLDPWLETSFQDVILTSLKMGLELLLNMKLFSSIILERTEHSLLVPAINYLEKEDCLFPNPAKFDLNFYAFSRKDIASIGGHDPWDVLVQVLLNSIMMEMI